MMRQTSNTKNLETSCMILYKKVFETSKWWSCFTLKFGIYHNLITLLGCLFQHYKAPLWRSTNPRKRRSKYIRDWSIIKIDNIDKYIWQSTNIKLHISMYVYMLWLKYWPYTCLIPSLKLTARHSKNGVGESYFGARPGFRKPASFREDKCC